MTHQELLDTITDIIYLHADIRIEYGEAAYVENAEHLARLILATVRNAKVEN